ncbi:MAG: YifB family Mg chelatase-like AAA ATPase [Actinomycetales bacterium]|nr:YifB family Mg chelatase-like AAA ATPase [Actinomycetales bacterium]
MSLARAKAAMIHGVSGLVVTIESFLSQGLPGLTLVGLADTAVGESRDRVRAAIQNSKLNWPGERRITIGLSPASVHKRGAMLDLGIALSLLAASQQIPQRLDVVSIGELSLDGKVNEVRGVIVAALAARAEGASVLLVPHNQVAEAQLVPELKVIGVSSLIDAVKFFNGEDFDTPVFLPPEFNSPQIPDLADVRGQPMARIALEIAAAGGHHLAMVGSPGVGKSMLAARLPGILPRLDDELAVTVTGIHSIAGTLPVGQGLITVPPFLTPHHSATTTSLVGGGSKQAKVGMVTLAHGGVLCLDEAAEFQRPVLDALRVPLETGEVVISRAEFTARLPAQFQLVLAANPCPCGMYVDLGDQCTCSVVSRRKYFSRLSGPLLDRIDLRVWLNRPTMADFDVSTELETSDAVAQRVAAARFQAAKRLSGTPWRTYSQVPGPTIRKDFPLSADAMKCLRLTCGGFSARGIDRVLRLAWTISDLNQSGQPTKADLEQALYFRDGGGQWKL